MEVIYRRCAGLDVHKDTVVACARLVEERGVRQEVRTFATTTPGLYALSEWLAGCGVTHAGMEATGVYWKPVWHVLEEGLELVLANAAHVKNVPGRKTDVNDAMWLADLLAHGLIQGSFVPERPIQELRDLTRARKQFMRERTGHVQRIQKVLEDANVKLASVISDVTGRTGRAILDAMVDGETDARELAKHRHPKMKATLAEMEQALAGRVTPHHRFMLGLYLGQVDATDAAVAQIELEADGLLESFRAKVNLLITMPGVGETVAEAILAEIGSDMSRFPTAAHLISWAGLCPRNDESAGKRRCTRIRQGAPWLKVMMVQAAWSAIKVKNGPLREQFLRLKSRRGPGKAIVAVAATMLRAAYVMLRDDVAFRDTRPAHPAASEPDRVKNRLVHRLQSLGYEVQLKRAA